MSEAEADKVDNLPFNWGKKGGVGGKKREVRFYESFTYDGVEYTLNDCVYMYKEDEPTPYVGKLVKIWENADKKKRVKIHWFFQPHEIVNRLGDVEVSPNEIFLASGEGVGLANINPLEAIAGKCNVVCVSKDRRNRQPSAKELEDADYIFYRTFDVGHGSISDKLDDKVGGLEVKFVFNKECSEQPADTLGLGSNQMEGVGVCKPAPELLRKGSSTIVEVKGKDGGSSDLALKESEVVKGPGIKSKISPGAESASGSPEDLIEVASSCGQLEIIQGEITSRHRDSQVDSKVKVSADEEDSLIKLKSSPKRRFAFGAPEDSSRVITTNGRQAPVSGDNTNPSNFYSHMDDAKVSKVGSNLSHTEEPIKHAKESDPVGNKPSKKSVVEDFVKPLESRYTNSSQKMVHGNDTESSAVVSCEKKTKSESGKQSLGLGKGVRSSKDLDLREEMPSKKARVENSVKSNENRLSIGVQKCNSSAGGNIAKDSTALKNSTAIPVTAAERSKSKVASALLENNSKEKIDEKMTSISNSQLTKVAGGHSRDAGRKKYDIIEVSRRPDDLLQLLQKAATLPCRSPDASSKGDSILEQQLEALEAKKMPNTVHLKHNEILRKQYEERIGEQEQGSSLGARRLPVLSDEEVADTVGGEATGVVEVEEVANTGASKVASLEVRYFLNISDEEAEDVGRKESAGEVEKAANLGSVGATFADVRCYIDLSDEDVVGEVEEKGSFGGGIADDGDAAGDMEVAVDADVEGNVEVADDAEVVGDVEELVPVCSLGCGKGKGHLTRGLIPFSVGSRDVSSSAELAMGFTVDAHAPRGKEIFLDPCELFEGLDEVKKELLLALFHRRPSTFIGVSGLSRVHRVKVLNELFNELEKMKSIQLDELSESLFAEYREGFEYFFRLGFDLSWLLGHWEAAKKVHPITVREQEMADLARQLTVKEQEMTDLRVRLAAAKVASARERASLATSFAVLGDDSPSHLVRLRTLADVFL